MSNLLFKPMTNENNLEEKEFCYGIYKDEEGSKDLLKIKITYLKPNEQKIDVSKLDDSKLFTNMGNLNKLKFRTSLDKNIKETLGIDMGISDVLPAIIKDIETAVNKMPVKVNEKEIKETKVLTPNLDGFSSMGVHPAIDFVNGTAYVGVYIPCFSAEGKEVESVCLVTSNNEVFHVNEVEMKERNLRLEHKCMIDGLRWNLSSIKNFTENICEPVEAKQLFNGIKEQYKTYIDFKEDEEYDLMASWIIGTYFFPLFESYPYVQLYGLKSSGKTKTAKVTSYLAFNGILTGNMSASSMYRNVQNLRATLILDENEGIRNPERAETICNILNTGYQKGLYVYRTGTKEEGFEQQRFETYSPKIISNVSGIRLDTLQDRVIQIVMLKTIKKEISEKDARPKDSIWGAIRNDLYLLMMENWSDIQKLYNDLENNTKLINRDWELWKPILAITKFIDQELYIKMKNFAEKKTKEKIKENTVESMESVLLQALADFVKEDDFYSVREIKEKMYEMIDNDPKWLSNEWIGRTLTKLGFKDKKLNSPKRGTNYLITRQMLNDLIKRYVDIGLEPLEPIRPLDDVKGSKGIKGSKCQVCCKEDKELFSVELQDKYKEGKPLATFLVCKECKDESEGGKND
ncbi:MAG: hypothetical protein PHU12_02825 [Candidatus Aenigmarchaeota archaeon]|nr:hypothetical protein [Candidatus Aenigmarchaeota archaeon]